MASNGWLGGVFNWNAGRARKTFQNDVDKVLAVMEEQYGELEDMPNEEFKALAQAKTSKWQSQLESGEVELEDIKHRAFALVLEAARRLMGMDARECQITCAMALNQRCIAEMKTGEGKTLVATMPVYLQALTGKGVHVMTVNDYLAKRDAEWMGEIYEYLGLTVGCIGRELSNEQRKAQYDCDITYGTNDQFGFDFLNDNLKADASEIVQRGHNFAIVDEADSIMIDEARTPLVISGPSMDHSDFYNTIDEVIRHVKPEHYDLDEKKRNVTFTEDGLAFVEGLLEERYLLNGHALHDFENTTLVHHLNQALNAHTLFHKNKDYVVHDDHVIIVNPSTGRLVPGQRWGEGQHQAIEAKEGVTIQPESETLASITRQNYLRQYEQLAGMTGTALTEAEEFIEIYGLDVMEIDSHKPLAREDEPDEVYMTEEEKYDAIVKEIKECISKGQPALVGTASVAKSEKLSAVLTENGIKHQVLNANNHEQEAEIIAEAGVPGAITIATNMAGRGTDIKLGGNDEMRIAKETEGMLPGPELDQKIAEIKADVAAKKEQAKDAGGLYVIGTERHESRRIDNQLRGRAGRQGDPGRSKFYLSLEDDLLRRFGSDRMKRQIERFNMLEKGEPIVHSWLTKAVENAQRKIEGRNYDIRKNLLKFGDVSNEQREIVFGIRRDIVEADDVSDRIRGMRYELIEGLVSNAMGGSDYPDLWNMDTLKKDVKETLGLEVPVDEWAQEDKFTAEEMVRRLVLVSDAAAAKRESLWGSDISRKVEKMVLLQTFDQMWRDQIKTVDALRSTIGLRGYAQQDPLRAFQAECFKSFENMLGKMTETVTIRMANADLRPVPPPQIALQMA